MTITGPLTDRFGRVHSNLRISVTDRCNIRCSYCMPAEDVRFKPRSEILTFEEITRFVSVVAQMGIHKLRITGGEPLVRAELPRLIRMLADIPGIRDVALTTNGILLAAQAAALRGAGLQRVNISLDTLDPAVFHHISRRHGLDQVLEGIAVAQRTGFQRLRLNTVVMRGVNDAEVVPLGQFVRRAGLELRFIEFMPLDADDNWQTADVLGGEEIRTMLAAAIEPLIPVPHAEPSQPAVNYRFADGRGTIGFINSVTEPFCGACNRLRLTAEGRIRNCLFSTEEWDVRALLRQGGSDAQIAGQVRTAVQAKKTGHGSDTPAFAKPEKAMYQIGG